MHQLVLNSCLTEWQRIAGLRLIEEGKNVALINRDKTTLFIFPDTVCPFTIQKLADNYLMEKSYDN